MRTRLLLSLASFGAPAWAQTAPATPPPAAESPAAVAPIAPAADPARPTDAPARRASGAPPARRGFQMHFVPLTALMIPLGDATGARGDSLGGRYGWQWMPFEVGIGAKVIDELYVGGYLNLGAGAEGSDLATSARCEAGDDVDDDVECSAVSVRAGIEARYTFTPSESYSGWLGYGVGFTSGTQYISDAGRYSESTTSQGIELGRITGGLDFRNWRGFGLGPFVMFSVGRYSHTRTQVRDLVTYSGDIDDPDLHLWVGVGLRMVVFP